MARWWRASGPYDVCLGMSIVLGCLVACLNIGIGIATSATSKQLRLDYNSTAAFCDTSPVIALVTTVGIVHATMAVTLAVTVARAQDK